MQKISDWDSVQAAGEFEPLEVGGHTCKILKAEATTTKSGRQAVRLYFDIVDGNQAGYFRKMFDNDDRQDKKWPMGGQYLQLTEGKSLPYFKGMLTSIEKSNSGYKWDWDEKKLAGKLFGGLFGREQYEKRDGTIGWSVKCFQIRSTEGINDAPAPADKLMKPRNDTFGSGSFANLDGDDGELPF